MNHDTMNELHVQNAAPAAAPTTADSYVHARIDSLTKQRAANVLKGMGLSFSDAIRMLMHHLATERRLPAGLQAPAVTSFNFREPLNHPPA